MHIPERANRKHSSEVNDAYLSKKCNHYSRNKVVSHDVNAKP